VRQGCGRSVSNAQETTGASAVAKGRRLNQRKVRTREHQIAAVSTAHVEALIAGVGYSAERVEHDYGYDLLLFTYGPKGEVENGLVYLQLKATDRVKVTKQGIVFRIDIRDYRLWAVETMPVFLVLFDAGRAVAHWLYIQNYFETDAARRPGRSARSVRVVIPVANVVDAAFIRHARERKADVLSQLLPQKIMHNA
jgi:hypothetical protein